MLEIMLQHKRQSSENCDIASRPPLRFINFMTRIIVNIFSDLKQPFERHPNLPTKPMVYAVKLQQCAAL